MLFSFLLLFSCIGGITAQNNRHEEISVTQFGAKADDGEDDTKALRKAAEYCRKHEGVTLHFPRGVYQLKDEAAIRLEQEVLDGKMGENPEKVIFTPYYPYSKGIDLSGARNVTLKATGATLLCEGWMEPISVEDCTNVTICGITIDYKRKPFATGDVVAVEKDYFDVQFEEERTITDKIPLMRMTFWHKSQNYMHPEPIYFPNREILQNNKVRFHHSVSKNLMDCKVGVGHSFHFRPGILILRSLNTQIIDVTIHSQPGMGIVGFGSKDIRIKRLSVIPAPGYYFSTNTDATHFACCEGVLHFDGCHFRGQGDDATNVHGYYQTILEADGNTAKLRVNAPTYTHAQVADVPRVNDKMELVDIKTLVPLRVYTVSKVEAQPGNIEPVVTFTEKLPDDFGSYYLMNITQLPHLIFENSLIDSHHARGILVKTRGASIKNNVFRQCTGTAIHVGTEGGWHEGTHSKDILIEGNVIHKCGMGAGNQNGACGIAVNVSGANTDGTFLHDNIRIENNLIQGDGNPCGIFVGNSNRVCLKGNEIQGCTQDVVSHNVASMVLID